MRTTFFYFVCFVSSCEIYSFRLKIVVLAGKIWEMHPAVQDGIENHVRSSLTLDLETFILRRKA